LQNVLIRPNNKNDYLVHLQFRDALTETNESDDSLAGNLPMKTKIWWWEYRSSIDIDIV